MLGLRHTNRALLDGSYTAINESDANVLAYLRVYKEHGVVVALNMSNAPQKVTARIEGQGLRISHAPAGDWRIERKGS